MPDETERDGPQLQVPAAAGNRVSWIRRLWPYLRAHLRDVVVGFGAAVVGLTVTALTPLVQKVVVDDVVLGHRRPLLPWLTVLVLAGLAQFGAAHVRRYVGGRVALDVQDDLRNDIYARLQRLDFARHDQSHTGQLVSRATGDVMIVQGLLAFLPLTTGNVVLLVLSLVIMAVLSPLLTVIALVAVPVLLVLAVRMRTTVFPAAWDAQQKAGEVAGVVDEVVTGVRVVKAFGQEQHELDRLTRASQRLFASRVRSARIEARSTATFQMVPALAQVAVLALGGWLALHGRISVGTFLAFSSYLIQLVAPVRMLSALLVVAQQARAGVERIFDILDANPDVVERDGARVLPEVTGEVVFDDVSFGYQRSRPVLSGFNLRVAPGETVALVGASGSGKSTVAMLLPRFYDALAGAVRVDGVDVRDVTFDSLRRQVGVVFEETFLFSDTVRANIAYGRPDATDDEVVAAARAAEAHEFLTALPDGYDTVLGERGLTLSGGQRQRVALARALLTDPRILVLDDATSAIDARVEEEIHATLRRLLRGRTTLLVAHRRSTLRLADRIAVVDGGAVVDVGTHADLLVRSPLYRTLLAGPGDGCEGDDESGAPARTAAAADVAAAGAETADETAGAETADGTAGAGTVAIESGGVTPAAWRPVDGAPPAPAASAPPAGATVTGAGHGRSFGGPQAADFMSRMGPTPELLAALAALPPPTDVPSPRALEVVGTATTSAFSLRSFLRPYRRQLAIGLTLVLLDTAASLAGPVLVRSGIDRGVVGGSEAALWATSAAFLAVVVANWANVYVQQSYTRRTAEELLFGLRVGIFRHLQSLGLDYYDREMPGRIMTRMTTDVESLSTLLQNGLLLAVVSMFSFAGVAVLMLLMDVRLSLATMTVLIPLVAATVWFRRMSAAAYDTARDRIATVNANLQESLSGVRVAQAYGREKRNIGEFRRVSREYFNARLGAQRLVATYFPFVELLSQVAAAVVLGVGASQIRSGHLTAGELIAFLLYLNQLFSPIQQLSQVFDTYQQARASMVKVGELLATPSSTPRPASPVAVGRITGALRFEGVRFRYPGTDTDALAGVDLDVRPGERIALVGETGAGKSTIVKLVARFYDPTEGAMLVDGVALTEIDLDAYRRQLGYVPQEVFLFSGTIRDNIAYGRAGVSDAEVEAAARAVGAHDLIAGLPGGYLHPVTERGRSLSAGQRQLIALSRAHLVDPAVLLLDEATSNLDLVTEARVTRAMQVLSRGRTTLVVAHRLPSAAGADRVVVVDGGRIVEQGPHADLLARGGRYAEMWRAFEVEPQAV
ncbi:MAG TPA: ABC transporter ATP-binding protein [Acidimicrobiales bacterium]|nr:ABC transporter ATP-binding protein [Acidimicrobiales bacterium]